MPDHGQTTSERELVVLGGARWTFDVARHMHSRPTALVPAFDSGASQADDEFPYRSRSAGETGELEPCKPLDEVFSVDSYAGPFSEQ